MYMRTAQILIVAILLSPGCKPRPVMQQIGTFTPVSGAFWEVVPKGAVAERIGIDFQFTEGPAWHPDGNLIFSDIPANTIYRWEGNKYSEFRKPSGASNGLLVEADGTVLACEHESRSITRYSVSGELDTLAESFMGRRFNSPNDLCKDSRGAIYFTDPPWGLPERNSDPSKELPYSGVFRLFNGQVTLLDSTLSWPNGIALSPEEDYLYVANFEQGASGNEVFWMRYTLNDQGSVTKREVFFKAEDLSQPGGPDGMKVDKKGNIFATGPGGILVISPKGEHLGTIGIPFPPSNLAFGPREKTLYVTARSIVVRINLGNRQK